MSASLRFGRARRVKHEGASLFEVAATDMKLVDLQYVRSKFHKQILTVTAAIMTPSGRPYFLGDRAMDKMDECSRRLSHDQSLACLA
mmetsp:Transcript_72968/g.156262  ORF Transcript_72968/g.156262 Transcript_72968/m.156262 type:complete len:87 (+) Transcript_72968:960-1220(+)